MSATLAMSHVVLDDPLDHDAFNNSTRPHSIDLSLELERQLESESLPNSPVPTARPQSLDTHVLASIVTQLRMSLEDMSKERDSLSDQLAESKYREQNLKEALQTVTEKCLHVEAELSTTRDQHKEDEEAISMLRQKVEESRRALMRLQTESRRMSQVSNLTLDLSRAGQPMMSGPPSSRRASFVPLTGSTGGSMGHRRIVSLSDPGLMSAPAFGQSGQWSTFPGASDFAQSARTGPPPSSAQSRRFSGFFGHGSAPPPDLPPMGPSEVQALCEELAAVKVRLEETKHELNEAHEAKEASEMCVRALRTFISENSVGEQTARTNARAAMKSPPVSAASPSSGSRWGFKLWAASETPTATTTTPPPSASIAVPSPGTKKLGGFFSPRSSISSTSPPSRLAIGQESTYHGSDTSSIADSAAEPVSPASSLPRPSVLVRDAEGSSFDSVALPESSKEIEVPA